ncbi:hypothetical protein CALVIDRAFT_542534 [Calocera viscosa TUFC12733]|uniref:Uncharacterized protein n=1 Tax=Calocera viscosa (strain TUFC12733) TaxID=1330018 RepID=A0A167GI30_CALVF|nr:hypothetical protein CALVIDRAFT_542534 [Calocera viscosa TUFC12733]
MAPRTRRQATQTTDSSDSAPQRPRRATRSTSTSVPKPAPAKAPRSRVPRSKRNIAEEEQESPERAAPSTKQLLFQPLAVSSPRTPNHPDTSEDRVEDLLNAPGNDSLQSLQLSQDILVPLNVAQSLSSPKKDFAALLPPSSPPSRLPSSSTDSGEHNPQALLPPSKRLGRPFRHPGMIRSRAQATQPEPQREPSVSPSSDPFGFFALERRLKPSKTEAVHRMEEQMQHEAEIMADEPSVQFSDGVPFASPMRRRMQEEESMAEVDAALAEVTNVFEPVQEEVEEVEQEEVAKKTRKPRSKATKADAVDELVARLPKRKPRSVARTKKNELENTSSDPAPRKTARKVSKAAPPKRAKADIRKRQKTADADDGDDPDEEVLQARDQRMKLYKDLEKYKLEEELVI